MIDRLNRDFVNVWVLNQELKNLREELGLSKVEPLARAIMKGWQWGSPVDCLVISPELGLLGSQPINALPHPRLAAYNDFLTSSLDGERPGVGGSSAAERPGVTFQKSLNLELKAGKEAQSLKNSPELKMMLEGFDKLAIELVAPGKFKIDDKGPFTAKEAKVELARVTRDKGPVLVMLKAGPKISDDEFKAFTESLRADGGLLDGIDFQAMTTVMRTP